MAALYTATAFLNASDYSAAVVPHGRRRWDTMPMRYPLTLKQIRKKQKLTQAAVADRIDMGQSTYGRWETGDRTPDAKDLASLADALGVEPGALFGEPSIAAIGPKLFVKGAVAAGVWREAVQWPEDEWQCFHGRPDISFSLDRRFGLRVEGESMSEIYPPGTIIECVSLNGGVTLESGKRVVVVRQRDTGEFEATVKEYVVDADGVEWLVPRSLNPAFKRAINVSEPEPGIEHIEIIAVVVGSYRPE